MVEGGGHERAGRSGFGEGAQVGDVPHAAAGQQLELGKAGAELAHQRDVGARAGSDAREVEHDHLPHARLRPAAPARPPLRAGRGRHRARGRGPPEVEAEHERGVGKLRPQPPERGRVRQRLGADHHARRAQLEQRPDRGDVGDAGVDHHPRVARQGRDDVAVERSTRDRVEIGDVELVEPELSADGASTADGSEPATSSLRRGR